MSQMLVFVVFYESKAAGIETRVRFPSPAPVQKDARFQIQSHGSWTAMGDRNTVETGNGIGCINIG
jgi:hypothetical protein